MDNIPRLTGGTVFTLILQALKPKTRELDKNSTVKLKDTDILSSLIEVIIDKSCNYTDSGTFKTTTSNYKSCVIDQASYLPFNNKRYLTPFDDRIKKNYSKPLSTMAGFVANKLDDSKYVSLAKALVDLILSDSSIANDEKLYISPDGRSYTKEQISNIGEFWLPSLILGVWHYAVINRNNTEGAATYDVWCPPNGHKQRIYKGKMGENLPELKVHSSLPSETTVRPMLLTEIIKAEARSCEANSAGANTNTSIQANIISMTNAVTQTIARLKQVAAQVNIIPQTNTVAQTDAELSAIDPDEPEELDNCSYINFYEDDKNYVPLLDKNFANLELPDLSFDELYSMFSHAELKSSHPSDFYNVIVSWKTRSDFSIELTEGYFFKKLENDQFFHNLRALDTEIIDNIKKHPALIANECGHKNNTPHKQQIVFLAKITSIYKEEKNYIIKYTPLKVFHLTDIYKIRESLIKSFSDNNFFTITGYKIITRDLLGILKEHKLIEAETYGDRDIYQELELTRENFPNVKVPTLSYDKLYSMFSHDGGIINPIDPTDFYNLLISYETYPDYRIEYSPERVLKEGIYQDLSKRLKNLNENDIEILMKRPALVANESFNYHEPGENQIVFLAKIISVYMKNGRYVVKYKPLKVFSMKDIFNIMYDLKLSVEDETFHCLSRVGWKLRECDLIKTLKENGLL